MKKPLKIKKHIKKKTIKSKSTELPKVKEGVETDFTGLPMNPFDPVNWES